MTIKDQRRLASLLCDHFVRPIKEYGVSHEELAANAMRFVQDFLKKEPGISEMIAHFEIIESPNAGAEFLEELHIKY